MFLHGRCVLSWVRALVLPLTLKFQDFRNDQLKKKNAGGSSFLFRNTTVAQPATLKQHLQLPNSGPWGPLQDLWASPRWGWW